MKKWINLTGMLVVVLLAAPMFAQAQPRWERREHSRERARGEIRITNDWRDTVRLSMWSHQRERIGEWFIRPGTTVTLGEGRDPIRVRANYKIKVGDDWGWVDVGQVGQFQQDSWYVSVRDIWRATHADRERDRSDVPDRRRSDGPDWRR